VARVAESINFIDLRPRRKALVQAFRLSRTGHAVHLRRPATHDIAALQDLAEHAFSDAELDLILITGDIATTGDREDVNAAFDFISRPTAGGWMSDRNTPTLAAADAPIVLLPGNHDRYENTKFPFGAAAFAFDDVFNEYWWVGQNASFLAGLEKEGEWLLILGADFSLRIPEYRKNPLSHAGQGEVSPHVLKSLRLLTRKCRERLKRKSMTPAVIWAIHFAPRCTDTLLRLRKDERFLAAAEADGVYHIFCGHTHEPAVPPPPMGNINVYCAGTASSFGSPRGNHIHTREIEVVNGTIVEIRSIDDQLGMI